jgi:hypothetical protein
MIRLRLDVELHFIVETSMSSADYFSSQIERRQAFTPNSNY